MDSFGQRLRRMRQFNVLTQAELAKRAGVSLITVVRLENDEGESNPRPATVRRLAEALGVDASWLLFGEESELGKEAA
jgi:transcriptional regulator with XRE-family HTH domain